MNRRMGTYERISVQILSKCKIKPKPFVMFENGKVIIGTQSLHKTQFARMYNTFWRMKRFYKVKE